MSIASAIAAGLMIAFALTGMVVCLSFPYARLVIMTMSPVTKRGRLCGLAFYFAIIVFECYARHSPLWLCLLDLAGGVLLTAFYWPKASQD